jgi:phage/plasmid-like protein (TIGR03299 family)
MAHALDMTNGRVNYAFVGAPGWHGLGNELEAGATLEAWAETAGLSHTVEAAPALYMLPGDDAPRTHEGRKVLYRSDTGGALANVSDSYEVLQPREVLEFYRELVDASGLFTLETAGSLHGGKKVWALAKSKIELQIGAADIVLPYLFLATSYDGTMATTGKFTTVRVVCQNTLAMADRGTGAAVRVPHSTKFNADAVKAELGLVETRAADFEAHAREMSKLQLAPGDAVEFFAEIFGRDAGDRSTEPVDLETLPKPRQARIEAAANAWIEGPGANLPGARGTLWGAVNAVTFLVDHEERPRTTQESRFNSAQFGPGAGMKGEAWDLAGRVLEAAGSARRVLTNA